MSDKAPPDSPAAAWATPAALTVVARLSRTNPIPFTERIDSESLQPLRQLLSGVGGRSNGRRRLALARGGIAR
jgi:hypothetical protein